VNLRNRSLNLDLVYIFTERDRRGLESTKMLEKADKAFLENALKEPISSFEISDGSKPGDNIAGSLKSIKVTTLEGKTIHLVLKVAADDPEQLDYAGRFGIYDIEACVYNQLNPRITKLMETKD